MKVMTKNEEETKHVAMNFAKQFRGGEMILLYGDLGAGKTVFVKGLAKVLGVREIIKSPTFNIMKCYKVQSSKFKVQKLLCHIDAYRLKNFDDLLDVGADEYLGKKNVISVVEWAERAEGIERLGGKIIKIKIEHGKKDTERIITIN